MIDGISVTQGEIGGNEVIQPDKKSSAYDSDTDMRYAIVYGISACGIRKSAL